MARRVLLITLVSLLASLPLQADEPIGVAVLQFESKGGIPQNRMEALSDMVAQRIQQAGNFRVIGKSDITNMLNMEEHRMKLSGCTDSSCLAEIGGALGVQYLTAGNISAFGEKYLLNLKFIDVGRAEVASRITRTVEGVENLLAEVPAAVDELLSGVAAFRKTGKVLDAGSAGVLYELTLNSCLGGSEINGYQIDLIDADIPVPHFADIGLRRWGVGGRFGIRFANYHTAFAQVDFLWEELSGRFSAREDSGTPLSTYINLLRILAGYRFAWPALDWLAPFLELGLGGIIYFPVQVEVSGATITSLELKADSRFAVMVGAGLRFSFLKRGFISLSWLYELPLFGFSSGSFLVGGGATF
ncbi:MAG TPA: CsgG/HfaB family protein [Myxococcota bacterium]|nr:CsgG/HfaB family protein [Myxococcota bacterium]